VKIVDEVKPGVAEGNDEADAEGKAKGEGENEAEEVKKAEVVETDEGVEIEVDDAVLLVVAVYEAGITKDPTVPVEEDVAVEEDVKERVPVAAAVLLELGEKVAIELFEGEEVRVGVKVGAFLVQYTEVLSDESPKGHWATLRF